MPNVATPTVFQIDLTNDLPDAHIITIQMTSAGFWHLYDTDFSGRRIGFISLTDDRSGFQAQQNNDQRPRSFAICQFRDAVRWIWQQTKDQPVSAHLR